MFGFSRKNKPNRIYKYLWIEIYFKKLAHIVVVNYVQAYVHAC